MALPFLQEPEFSRVEHRVSTFFLLRIDAMDLRLAEQQLAAVWTSWGFTRC